MIRKLHHNAYRCRDSGQTRAFHEDVPGLPLAGTLEIGETKSGRATNTLHTFYRLDDGSLLAFFEARGVSDHAFIDSIYFRDPSGYVIELCARREAHDQAMDPRINVARAKLQRWTVSKPERGCSIRGEGLPQAVSFAHDMPPADPTLRSCEHAVCRKADLMPESRSGQAAQTWPAVKLAAWQQGRGMGGSGSTTTAQLREDAAQLRLIADSVPAMSIAYDKHLRCLFANQRFAEFFGLTTTNIVGKHLREIIGEGPYQEVKAPFDQVLAGQRATYKRTRVLDSGELRSLEVELIPHLGPDGGSRGLFAVTTDVTEREHVQAQLRESEARFRSLTGMSSDFFWESDTEHRLTLLSAGDGGRGVPPLYQTPRLGERRWEVPYLSPDAAGWREHQATLDSHVSFRDFCFSRPGNDGIDRHISISGDPILDATGGFKGYRGVGTDFTVRKRAELALHHVAEELRLFADNVPAMTVSFDANLKCRFVNKSYAAFFGFAVEDVIGKHAREIAGEAVYRDVEGFFAQVLQGHAVTYQRTQMLPDGERRHLEVKLLPHVLDSGVVHGCFGVVADITVHKQAEERIRHVAHHDGLTGLPNRMLFNDRLQQTINLAKRDSRQFALLFVDLDKFKPVNDALGHAAGDELLQRVAERVLNQVRASDTVARVGGDEFTVILPCIARPNDAQTAAMKLIAALSLPFHLETGAHHVEVGASVGIAVYPDDGTEPEALVRAADAAMYRAKQVGGCFRFYTSPTP